MSKNVENVKQVSRNVKENVKENQTNAKQVLKYV